MKNVFSSLLLAFACCFGVANAKERTATDIIRNAVSSIYVQTDKPLPPAMRTYIINRGHLTQIVTNSGNQDYKHIQKFNNVTVWMTKRGIYKDVIIVDKRYVIIGFYSDNPQIIDRVITALSYIRDWEYLKSFTTKL